MQIEMDDRWCKGCQLCIKVCPKGVLILSDKRSQRGYLMPHPLKAGDCIGCRLCEKMCPDLCINVEEQEDLR